MTVDGPHDIVEQQRAYFQSGQTLDLAFRLQALRRLLEQIAAREADISRALHADLHKSAFEAYSTEIGFVLAEIRFTLRHLHRWVRPERVRTPLTHLGAKSLVIPQPYGVTLIIAPWNYPFQLAIAPLIGAIAAGNCAVIKPSEWAPRTAMVVQEIVSSVFPKEHVCVVQGAVEETQALLAEPFDYIFFTGSTAVGRVVMEAAAKHLTPVTLELGGKSPAIVHRDARLDLAAKRIAWGKFTNAGQTCIAPDYVYVHRAVRDAFLTSLQQAIVHLYGPRPLENPAYTRIVSEHHFHRLMAFIQPHQVFLGGQGRPDERVLEPTVLVDVTWEDPVMQEEIFGPILPVLVYEDLGEVMEALQSRPKPLALYLFTQDAEIERRVLERVPFGGGCVNDTLYHFASPHLPFGGVGHSGMGAYHGRASFDTFSHRKSVLKQTVRFDLPFRYPNQKDGLKWVKRFLR
ncbi:aldehyde dehydrogenase [Alicyclobacillus sp.]|uniref:aldehyde dehydrogenase n=1 Tax=Alicyclobacillus sp. TaxID=61169 RepID=UPI0025C02464|nr:aldehyde dehydrogenase [Alicyclobacillus sp.]MCL6515302.1 aldehyde dehydrogenase [Alicyclobacillus sp.]